MKLSNAVSGILFIIAATAKKPPHNHPLMDKIQNHQSKRILQSYQKTLMPTLHRLLLSLVLAAAAADAQNFYPRAPFSDAATKSIQPCCEPVPLPPAWEQKAYQAAALLHNRHPQEAVSILNPLVAQTRTALARDPRRAYASFSDETAVLAVLLQAARAKQSAYVVSRAWVTPLYLRAYAYRELGDLPKAKADLDAALQLAPLDPQVLNERGQYFLLKKELAAAEADFEKALESATLLKPNPQVTKYKGLSLRSLGYVAVERGQWDKAVRFYQKALALNPEDTLAQAELAFIRTHRR